MFSPLSWNTGPDTFFVVVVVFTHHSSIESSLTSQLRRLGPATTLLILTKVTERETEMSKLSWPTRALLPRQPTGVKARLVNASHIRKAWDRQSLCVYSSLYSQFHVSACKTHVHAHTRTHIYTSTQAMQNLKQTVQNSLVIMSLRNGR